MITTIKFAKLKDSAKIPSKEDENAGYDIYACFDEDYIIIPPHSTKLIPTGICSAFDEDYFVLLEERGSTGSKGMKRSAGVIDSSYRGEWFVALSNVNNIPIAISKVGDNIDWSDYFKYIPKSIIYPYNKAICQALLLPVPKAVVEEYTLEEIQAIPSNRGNGKLGSSGK